MPGPRQKLSVLEGNGRKHLSKAEKAQRAQQEVNLPKPKSLRVPKWLPEAYRKEFRALARELLAADMGAAQLDADTLGRYVVAQAQYMAVTGLIQTALAKQDGPGLEGGVQAPGHLFPPGEGLRQRPGYDHHQPVPTGDTRWGQKAGGEPL